MRITGRQLRRIIQEEVARMMNEEPLPGGRVISPVTQQNYADAFAAIQGALNDSCDLDMGATVGRITNALRGKDQAAVAIFRKEFSKSGPNKIFTEAGVDDAKACVRSILQLNGVTAGVTTDAAGGRAGGGGVRVTVQGRVMGGDYVVFSDVDTNDLASKVMSTVGRGEFFSAAEAAGYFLREKFGA